MIEWETDYLKEPLTWAETLSYLTLKQDFRLPNKEELAQAYREKTEGFSESLYWTNEELESMDSIFFVDFYKGIVSFCGKESKLFVRLIKK